MLFLQCGECGFRTAPGTLEVGASCPRCVRRGGGGRMIEENRHPASSGERRRTAWSKGRVEMPS